MSTRRKILSFPVWLTLQPNGVVYVTHGRPELSHDDGWLTDDNSHDFLIIPNAFGMSTDKRISQAQIKIAISLTAKEDV